jgi:hypothetical protein
MARVLFCRLLVTDSLMVLLFVWYLLASRTLLLKTFR